MISPSLRSAGFGVGVVVFWNVLPGTMPSLGLSARTMDRLSRGILREPREADMVKNSEFWKKSSGSVSPFQMRKKPGRAALVQ